MIQCHTIVSLSISTNALLILEENLAATNSAAMKGTKYLRSQFLALGQLYQQSWHLAQMSTALFSVQSQHAA
jgi:hypothetical protein